MTGKKLFIICALISVVASSYAATPVETHGQLTTSGGYLLNKNGKIVQLRGISFFWSTPEWEGYRYYNAATVDALVDTWKCTVIRVAYDRDNGNDKGWAGCQTVINRAIQRGIYVIIDWHSHTAHEQQSQAVSFFTKMANDYKNVPNVLFEPYNEPKLAGGAVDGSPTEAEKTWKAIRPYFNAVISAIRGTGNNNLVIVGTPYYCQFPYIAMANPPAGNDGKAFTNIAYSFHFYAASHGPEAYYVKNGDGTGGEEANYFSRSLGKGPLFITEWGTTHSDGGVNNTHTYIDAANTKWWFDKYINGEYHVSHCAWSASDFQPSSAFSGSASTPSASGAVVKTYLNASTDTYGMASDTGKPTHYKDSVFTTPRTVACYKYGRYWGANADSVTVSYSSRDNADPREAKTTAVQVSTGINDEYIMYQINASTATKYIKIRALSKDGTGTIDVMLDGTKIGSITIPKNAAWTTTAFPLNVSTGKHTLKFAFTGATASYYMNWFELTNDSTTAVKLSLDKADKSSIRLSLIRSGFAVSLPASHRFSSYNLIGVDGRVVKSGNLTKGMSQLNFDNLSSGTWLLKVNSINGSRVIKAVVTGN